MLDIRFMKSEEIWRMLRKVEAVIPSLSLRLLYPWRIQMSFFVQSPLIVMMIDVLSFRTFIYLSWR